MRAATYLRADQSPACRTCLCCPSIPQLIKGNTFGGTAFASYGAFWMGWFLLEYLSWTNKAMFPGVQSGKSLWCGLWAVLTFGFFIVTCRKNGCLMTIFRCVHLAQFGLHE